MKRYWIILLAVVLAACGGGGQKGNFSDPTWTSNGLSIAYSVVRHDIDEPAPAGPHLEFATQSGPLPTFPDVTGDSDPDYSPTGSNPDWQPVF